MNAKKVKMLRQIMRRNGVAVTHTEYKAEGGYAKQFATGRTDSMGAPIISEYWVPGTVRLKPRCGRALYKKAKREIRAA